MGAAANSGSISFVSYFSFASKRLGTSKVHSYLVARRVGAHLAVSTPPGTVRAPLDAYGSTADNTERAVFSEANLWSFLDRHFGETCNTDDPRSLLEVR